MVTDAGKHAPRTKYWDLRSPTPLATVELKERCYAMDVKNKVLVVGTAGRHIQIFDLANPITPYKVGAYSPSQRLNVEFSLCLFR